MLPRCTSARRDEGRCQVTALGDALRERLERERQEAKLVSRNRATAAKSGRPLPPTSVRHRSAAEATATARSSVAAQSSLVEKGGDDAAPLAQTQTQALPRSSRRPRGATSWLDLTLASSSLSRTVERVRVSADLPAVPEGGLGSAHFRVDASSLEALGLTRSQARRAHQALFVYSQGVHELLGEVSAHAPEAAARLWRVLVFLLDEATASAGAELSAHAQRHEEERVSELLRAARAHQDRADAALEATERARSECAAQLGRVRSELASRNDELLVSQAQASALQRSNAEHAQRLQRAEVEAAAMRSESGQQAERLRRALAQAASHQDALHALEQRCARLNAQVAEQRSQASECAQRLEQQQARLAQTSFELDASRRAHEDLSQLHQAALRSAAQLHEKAEAVRTELLSTQSRLRATTAERDASRADAARDAEALRQQQAEAGRLATSLREEQEKGEGLGRRLREAEEGRKELSARAAELAAELEKLRPKVEESQRRLRQVETARQQESDASECSSQLVRQQLRDAEDRLAGESAALREALAREHEEAENAQRQRSMRVLAEEGREEQRRRADAAEHSAESARRDASRWHDEVRLQGERVAKLEASLAAARAEADANLLRMRAEESDAHAERLRLLAEIDELQVRMRSRDGVPALAAPAEGPESSGPGSGGSDEAARSPAPDAKLATRRKSGRASLLQPQQRARGGSLQLPSSPPVLATASSREQPRGRGGSLQLSASPARAGAGAGAGAGTGAGAARDPSEPQARVAETPAVVEDASPSSFADEIQQQQQQREQDELRAALEAMTEARDEAANRAESVALQLSTRLEELTAARMQLREQQQLNAEKSLQLDDLRIQVERLSSKPAR